MHAEGLGNAGAEAISLDQCTHKRTDVVNPSAIDQISEGLGARFSGAQFEVQEVKFIAQVGVRVMEVLADPHEGLVKSETSLNANDREIEGIGKSEANTILAIPDHALQDESRQNEAESRDADNHRKIVETRKSNDGAEAD